MNELVKVISLSFDDQKKLGKGIKIPFRTHVGEVTDDNGVVVAKISKSLNNMTIMVEIDGVILGLNVDAFVHHIVNNHKKYTEAEFNKLKEELENE